MIGWELAAAIAVGFGVYLLLHGGSRRVDVGPVQLSPQSGIAVILIAGGVIAQLWLSTRAASFWSQPAAPGVHVTLTKFVAAALCVAGAVGAVTVPDRRQLAVAGILITSGAGVLCGLNGNIVAATALVLLLGGSVFVLKSGRDSSQESRLEKAGHVADSLRQSLIGSEPVLAILAAMILCGILVSGLRHAMAVESSPHRQNGTQTRAMPRAVVFPSSSENARKLESVEDDERQEGTFFAASILLLVAVTGVVIISPLDRTADETRGAKNERAG